MKNSSLLILLLAGLLIWPGAKPPEDHPADKALFFQLALQLLLTENYEEAEAIFSSLAKDYPDDAAIQTNRGVNQAMWGLSLIKESQAIALIKYVFPFEVKPNSGKRGEIGDEQQFIGRCFEQAVQLFKRSVELQPADPGGFLNLASAQALQARWTQDPGGLRTAHQSLQKAFAGAKDGSSTKGFSYIVQGIIYDYLGNDGRRDDAFQLAWDQHQLQADTKLASLVVRNRAIAEGGAPVFVKTDGERFNVFEDEAETVDGVSLQQLVRSSNLEVSNTVAELGSAKLYEKQYPQSTLYIYHQSASRYLFFHRTGSDYQQASMKGVRIGQNEAFVKEAYGEPLRVMAAQGGRYLFYKKAKLLFFVGGDGTVKSWTVWRAKG